MLRHVASMIVSLVLLSSCRNESLLSDESDSSSQNKQLLPFGTAVAAVGEIGQIPDPNPVGGSDGGAIGVAGPAGPMGPAGPQGPKGEKGDKGDAGAEGKRGLSGSDGKNGSSILAGFYNPLDSQGNDDDLYFDQENGDMYKKVSGAWSFVTSLMGEKGEEGEQGIQGEQGLHGLDGVDGEKGDTGERGLMGYTGATGAQGIQGIQGIQGDQGDRGYGAGIVSRPATNCPSEANGGTQFTTFVDKNSDGQLSEDDVVTSISVVCGGLAGQDGRAGESSRLTVVLANASQCPAGGYVYTSQNGNETQSMPVCNGTQGLQGLQGVAGAPGSSVTPVKFCVSDNTRFPEYGLLIGNELFAVYWGPQPYSPNASTAFLAKVVPGSYRSTGGNGCYFKVDANNHISY